MTRSADGDRDLVYQVALDYFEGWFDGDVQRMDRARHEELVKRSPEIAGAADQRGLEDRARTVGYESLIPAVHLP